MNNIIYAAYIRKSSEDDNRQVLSMSAQRDELNELAEKAGLKISYWFEEAKSAKDPGRLEFNRLMEMISADHIQGIVCWKLDRLARNPIDSGAIQHFLHRGKLKEIVTPQKTYYETDSTFMTAFEFANSTQFVRDLSVNVKRGLKKRLAVKKIPTGLAKFGYYNDKTKDKGDRDWLIDNERLSIVQQMLEMYLSGNYSGGDIYKWAITTGVTTRKNKKLGGRPIKQSQIYNILKDPLYAGYFYDKNERIELHESLPRLINEDQHNKILRMLGRTNAPKTQKHVVTFAGFVFSASNEMVGPDVKQQVICQCKHKFSYLNKTNCPKCKTAIDSINKPKYLEYVFYRNNSRKKRGESVKYIEEGILTRKFLSYVEENLVLSESLTRWCKDHFKELNDAELQSAIVVNKTKETRKEQLESKKVKYREMYADGLTSKVEYLQDIAKLDEELIKVSSSETQNSERWLEKANTIVSIGVELVNIFQNGTVNAKRSIISRLGSNLIWNEKNLDFINTKPIQTLIDGLKRAKEKNKEFEPRNVVDVSGQNPIFSDICPILLPR